MDNTGANEPTGFSVTGLLGKIGLGFLTRGVGLSFAAVVFIMGSVSGAYLEGFIRNLDKDFFGPTIEELLEKEKFDENFSSIQMKLDRLSQAAPGDDFSALHQDLVLLMSEQEKYVRRLQGEISSNFSDRANTKQSLLKGVAPQADFTLHNNRGVTLGMRGVVFSTLKILNADASRILVKLNNRNHHMTPGSQIKFTTEEEICVVAYVGGNQKSKTTNFNMSCTTS
jgi:hypothetical protein